MLVARVAAGDIGVQPLDLVDEPGLGEEIQRPVDHRRLRTQPLGAQPVEDLVGAHRAVRLAEQFQHPHPGRGQAQAAGLGGAGKLVEHGLAALAVVVFGEGEGGVGHDCYVITLQLLYRNSSDTRSGTRMQPETGVNRCGPPLSPAPSPLLFSWPRRPVLPLNLILWQILWQILWLILWPAPGRRWSPASRRCIRWLPG